MNGLEIRKVRWANWQQKWLFEAGPQPTLLVGGFESAKTYGAILKLIYLLVKYPGSRGAIIRSVSSQIRKTTIQTFDLICPPSFISSRNDQEGHIIFVNGSRLDLIHLDKPGSLRVLKGLEINFALVDQAEELSLEAWDILETRIGRWRGFQILPEMMAADWPCHDDDGNPTLPRYLFATANPTDELHWLFTRFADESPEREYWAARGYQCRHVSFFENRYGTEEARRVYANKDEDFQRRYVKGLWGNVEGQIFNVDKKSELPYSPALLDRIRRTMKHHRSMDHGDTAPVVVLNHATDYDGNIFVWREYYVENLTVSQHRKAIWALSKDDPKYYSQLADPSIFAKSRGRTADSPPKWSVADEWKDVNLSLNAQDAIHWKEAPTAGSWEADLVNRGRLKEYLLVDPNHRHPITGELGAPHIYFVMKSPDYPNGCDRVVKEIKTQRRKKVVMVGGKTIWSDERDDTIVDHGYDACVYFVVSRPSLGATPAPRELPVGMIPIQQYEIAEEHARVRRRREERMQGVARAGYG